jgi:serpin B
MKDNNLFDALENIDPDLIEAADEPYKKDWKPFWTRTIAAILVIALSLSIFKLLDPCVARPHSPVMLSYADWRTNPNGAKLWKQSVDHIHNQPDGFSNNLQPFFTKSMQTFLSSEQNANTVYSPVNLYMALTMLAECADGNTRQQIMTLLNTDSIDKLRTQADQVWNSLYWDDGRTTSVLANSLWIDSSLPYNPITATRLAGTYHASVYHGNLSSDKMNKQVTKWLNKQTNDLLTEQTDGQGFSPETVLALISTILFQAKWEYEFDPASTRNGIFYSPNGERTVPYMYKGDLYDYYWQGSNFGMMRLSLSEGTGFHMWFVLPDEGTSVQDVIQDGTCFQIAQNPKNTDAAKRSSIYLKVPKFDITSKIDIEDGLKNLGITDAFGSEADFSAISSKNLFVSKAEQACRVAIDEYGVTGASYTKFELLVGGGTKPIEFYLTRPFLFLITSEDGIPLFAGVVNEP